MELHAPVRDLLDIELTPEQVTNFNTYESLLIEWNEHTNLTAITEPDEIRVRHFLDSLTIAKAADLSGDLRGIDIGAGAGFPGLPLAIAFENLHMTLLDSVGKKVSFMQHVIYTLKLPNATATHARAEELGQNAAHRATYDLVLARAVARLPGLLEYMLPLAKVGGYCIAMKGTTAHEEAESAARALNTLGGILERIENVQLPGVEIPHHLVVVRKLANTPAAYPRRPGTPTRKPIA
ncbi:MAG: 16S rRNA (guanine(527)-N(7))-methyltransferase RsmG [Chloroflexota bacterium]